MVLFDSKTMRTNKTPFRSTLAFLMCLSFSSCYHLYYSPNSSNVPLFKEKGEARLNAYYSGGEEIEGAEIQGAVAVSNSIGIILNTAFMGSSEGDESGNGYLIEGGAGYYKVFEEHLVFETYGGLGIGQAENNYVDWSNANAKGSSQVNFTKAFIQPSLGFTVKNVDFGVASKLSAVFMHVNEESGYTDSYGLDYIKANPTSYLWEPSFFVRFGFQSVKAQIQYTHSANLNNKDLDQEIACLSLGLSFNIKPKSKQQ